MVCPHCGRQCRTDSLRRNCPRQALPPVIRNAHPEACVHRGANRIGEKQCETCACKVMVFIFPCEALGRCTIKKKISGLPVCESCPAFTAISS